MRRLEQVLASTSAAPPHRVTELHRKAERPAHPRREQRTLGLQKSTLRQRAGPALSRTPVSQPRIVPSYGQVG